MNYFRRLSNKIKFLIAVLAIGFIFVCFNRDKRNFEISKNLNIYATMFRELNLFYVDDINPSDLVTKSIDGALKQLDPYTIYYPESRMDEFKLLTTGKYAGIGSLISRRKGMTVIVKPYKNSPAHKGGLKAGDILLNIDGTDLKGKSADDVSGLLKGKPGVDVKIKIERPGVEKPVDIVVTRENIQIPALPYYGIVNDTIGYIVFSQFTNKCASKVRKAILDLKSQGARSLVLDLRNNPGGLLDQAIDIANFFVQRGEPIVSTKGKVSKWDKTYKARNNPILPDMPLAVLINRGSASASEIVSGAIQDLDRGVVLGQRSFGKGLVQTTRNLVYNTKLKVTTAKYYTPSGRCVQALDYSHRNEDGSVGKIPDSLITEYTTRNGRKVYDGGGVMPDIDIKPYEYSKISANLVGQSMIFDFVTQYLISNEISGTVKEFKVDDKIWDAFKTYIKDKDFKYETRCEMMLHRLESIAKTEKYFSISEEEFKQLKAKLAHSLDKDLELFEKEIKELIAEEILGRTHFLEGVIEYRINNDKELKEAISVLNNKDRYNKILSAQK